MYGRLSRAFTFSSSDMESHSPHECKICLEDFDSKSRRPRSLPCGHTFCTLCITDMIKNSKINCPHCRAKHLLKHATELPVSYIVEEFMAREKYGDLPGRMTATSTCQTVETGETVGGKGAASSLNTNRSQTSLNRVSSGAPGAKSCSSSCWCCCYCNVFKKMCRCLPTWITIRKRLLRRRTARSVRDLGGGTHRMSRIYAVKEDNNRLRSAVMSLQDGRMYLHTLRNQPAPSSRTLKHSDMVALLDNSTTTAFMDLAWSGMVQGRILIQLYTSTLSGQIFLKLCTGESGPTYANTNFLEVHYRDRPGEYVLAGSSLNSLEVHRKLFDENEGTDVMCQTTGQAGLVWGRSPSDISRFGQFSITTREPSQRVTYMQVLGRVIKGLEVVIAAGQHTDITEVKVVDCGVLVPL